MQLGTESFSVRSERFQGPVCWILQLYTILYECEYMSMNPPEKQYSTVYSILRGFNFPKHPHFMWLYLYLNYILEGNIIPDSDY